MKRVKHIENWEQHIGVDVQLPEMTPRLLVVDDDELVLEMLASSLADRGYSLETARSIQTAEEQLSGDRFDILILDVKLGDGEAFALLDHHPNLSEDAIVVLMSGADELDNVVQGLRRGVQDFIVKPFTIPSFEERLHVAIDRWRAQQSTRYHQEELEALVLAMNDRVQASDQIVDSAFDETVRALGAAINLRDPETEDHCWRVSQNCVILASQAGFPEAELKYLRWGSYLHDIGKIGIPEAILTKNGPLTTEEMDLIRLHPLLGYRMISNIEFLRTSSDIVLYHHERYDGGGYPYGLSGAQIPFAARLFAVIDTMDAMLYDRPYRRGTTYDRLLEELERQSGKQFDPDVLAVFYQIPADVWTEAERGPSAGDPTTMQGE